MKHITTTLLYALLAAFLLDYRIAEDRPASVKCDGGEPEPYTAAEIDDAYRRATEVLQDAPLPECVERWWQEQAKKGSE
jgi:hypothetical protein